MSVSLYGIVIKYIQLLVVGGGLPFGLCVSKHIFQPAMGRIVAVAPGCVGIAEDVVVYGRDNVEHDKNLLRLWQVVQKEENRAKYKIYARCQPHKTRSICNSSSL